MNSLPLALFTRHRLRSCGSPTASMTKIKLGYVEFTPKALTQSRGVHHEDDGGLPSDGEESDGRGKVCRHLRYHGCSVCLSQTPARYPHPNVAYFYFSILARRRTVGLSDLHPNLPNHLFAQPAPGQVHAEEVRTRVLGVGGLHRHALLYSLSHHLRSTLVKKNSQELSHIGLSGCSAFWWISWGKPPLRARISRK